MYPIISFGSEEFNISLIGFIISKFKSFIILNISFGFITKPIKIGTIEIPITSNPEDSNNKGINKKIEKLIFYQKKILII